MIVIINYYCRYFETALTKSTKAENIIEFLDGIFTLLDLDILKFSVQIMVREKRREKKRR